jgi:predicted Zn-dependent protease
MRQRGVNRRSRLRAAESHELEGRKVQQIRRSLGWMVLCGLAGGALGPAAAFAQAGRPQVQQQLDRLLVLAPVPADPGDSTMAIAIGDEFRSRMEGKTRRQMNVITKERIGEALEASGFGREALLDASASEQLARFLQADAYIVGQIDRNSPAVHLRLVDIRRTGLSGWVHYRLPSDATAKAIAEGLADQMDAHLRAADAARDCIDRRDRRDFQAAKDRARRAFQFVPNHAGAATCLAVVFEAAREPPDSQIAALEIAVKGDSTSTRAWEMLGRQYQAKGDTLKAAETFIMQLQADPTDGRLRTGIAALLITQKQYERARQLLDEGLRQNPTDIQLQQLKARACKDGSLWSCLLEAHSALFELDTSLVGNAQFYFETFGAAQSANDTAAMLRWSGAAVQRFGDNVAFWRARANALKTARQDDAALVAYERIAQLDSSDIASRLQIAEIVLAGVRIDSGVPLDTGRLARVDSLLSRVIALRSTPAGAPADTNVWLNVAFRYFQPGSQMVQKRVSFRHGTHWLERAVQYDVRRQLTQQASFFLGLGFFFQLGELDARLRESKSCDLVSEEAELVAKAKAAMTAGAGLQQATANQILQYLGQYEGLIPQYRQSFRCR